MVFTLATGLVQLCTSGWAADPSFDRRQDIVYGRKFGTALTMDAFTPKKEAKGVGVILVASAGFVSSHDLVLPMFIEPLINRGYTVFAVLHGSQPRYTIPEIVQDMNRAVRFIRYHAKDYGIDPERIGIMGASAGGHLSLMLGTAGDQGNPKAKDPIDRTSSRVQAVACFFPPTDFLNYGKMGDAKIRPLIMLHLIVPPLTTGNLMNTASCGYLSTTQSGLRKSPDRFHRFIMSHLTIHPPLLFMVTKIRLFPCSNPS